MRLVERIDFSDEAYLIALGDLHLGSPSCNVKKFEGYVDWVAARPNAYVFLMGDIFDTALLNSPTSPFGQTMSLNKAQTTFEKMIKKIQDRIIGAVTGNHCNRLLKVANYNPLEGVCDNLGIPYCEFSAAIRMRIGTLSRTDGSISPKVNYIYYAHHSTGGGATVGGKLNRAYKMMEIFEGADCYLSAHNHQKALALINKKFVSVSGNGKAAASERRIAIVNTGSFVGWDSDYPEMMMLPPSEQGAARIRMSGLKRDLHVSF